MAVDKLLLSVYSIEVYCVLTFFREKSLALLISFDNEISVVSAIVNRFRFPAGLPPDFRIWESTPDDATGRLVFSGIYLSPRPYSPALLHTHLASALSALKTSMLRAALIHTHQKSCVIVRQYRGTPLANQRRVAYRSKSQPNQCRIFRWTRYTRLVSKRLAQTISEWNGVRLSPCTLTAGNQCAVDIAIFVHKTVESILQRNGIKCGIGRAFSDCRSHCRAGGNSSPAMKPEVPAYPLALPVFMGNNITLFYCTPQLQCLLLASFSVGRGGVVVRILATRQGESGSISGWVTPRFKGFLMWESCWTVPLVGGFSRGSPVSLDLAFRCCYWLFQLCRISSRAIDSCGRVCPLRITVYLVAARSDSSPSALEVRLGRMRLSPTPGPWFAAEEALQQCQPNEAAVKYYLGLC
ncbi:hypothetical protein PR048_013767 [Dryococelus australis]|uniref:Uncharacterized protein n=1 Tax=Dryococelus australis TaxID=614101 RepID=A0ABQ9HT38_9NEOP|nr:hypothetical protein PR048_013767 [Dryococelus australis]